MHRSDLPGAGYIGRFAPSPTGPLHAGSLVAALASWLDARAYGGKWLVRIEDVDLPRCVPGADRVILEQLEACGLVPDDLPVWQSRRDELYADALQHLLAADHVYACACSRREISLAAQSEGQELTRHAELVYPGTCRNGLKGKAARAMRVRTLNAKGHDVQIEWTDRRLGAQRQNLARAVGDFVLHRADGLWAYQMAVVVDDALQGVSHVVRGEDLSDNTPRQIHLQRLLGLPTPVYLHTPLVLGANGEKLSKQNGATPLNLRDCLAALRTAGVSLGIATEASDLNSWLTQAIVQWREKWALPVA
ncbi:MAG: tRNA glutamyl-Q(34) synthetase GluQRS [Burkholderiales bacterium]|jgi:glutamyl-Q tRNA(Asp) synthetase|nr:tRNA glutamyl-Q(34) synthetase GluQRS [Burkholderiales bacterium]